MYEFLTDLRQYPFLQNALLTGLLAGVACGVIGTYIVVRRISYIAGGIAHSVLAGLGAAFYLQRVHHWSALQPVYGALVVAVIAAITIGLVSLKARQREDTAISALWAVGMAIGIVFISMTPGYNEELMGYLFGNILLVSSSELWMLGGLDVIIVVLGLLFYNQFLAVCFDQEFARLRGMNVEFFYLLLLALAALTVVILATVVGIVMVVALLTSAGGYRRSVLQDTVDDDDCLDDLVRSVYNIGAGDKLRSGLPHRSDHHPYRRLCLPFRYNISMDQ